MRNERDKLKKQLADKRKKHVITKKELKVCRAKLAQFEDEEKSGVYIFFLAVFKISAVLFIYI